jgi:hypothetical protein
MSMLDERCMKRVTAGATVGAAVGGAVGALLADSHTSASAVLRRSLTPRLPHRMRTCLQNRCSVRHV